MSYEFLRTYTIPTNITESGHPYTHSNNVYQQYDGYQYPQSQSVASAYLQANDRFIPPGKIGTGYKPMPSRPLKRKAKVTEELQEVSADGKLVMFQGRDATYPDNLNKLIHPLSCDLCKSKMNSMHSAKDHYESKAHDRHITAWLQENYAKLGLEVPVVKRFIKQGSTGPEAYRCELCDLKLTSLTHANQHYAGRKHRLVVSNISKPSGLGYYDSDGRWVRTATKGTLVAPSDGRFGIGEQFKTNEPASTDGVTSTSGAAAVMQSSASSQSALNKSSVDNLLSCAACNITTTSASQMAMHLEGVKHHKKLKLAGVLPTTEDKTKLNSNILSQSSNSILANLDEKAGTNSDLSMYRTPSGSYYCKTCNMSMCHIQALQQHLSGKKHIRKFALNKTTPTVK